MYLCQVIPQSSLLSEKLAHISNLSPKSSPSIQALSWWIPSVFSPAQQYFPYSVDTRTGYIAPCCLTSFLQHNNPTLIFHALTYEGKHTVYLPYLSIYHFRGTMDLNLKVLYSSMFLDTLPLTAGGLTTIWLLKIHHLTIVRIKFPLAMLHSTFYHIIVQLNLQTIFLALRNATNL